VRSLAHARRQARLARDWGEADRLKAEIESAGWRVVDRGPDFALTPTAPPDVVVEGVGWYGSSASVPSVLGAAAERRVTLLAAGGHASALRDGPGMDAQVVVVLPQVASGSDGTPDATDATDIADVETVRLAGDPGPGALLAAGLRRALGEVVILVDPAFAPAAPWIEPLLGALDDASVACAGACGATTADLRTFAGVDAGDADVLLPGALAFRRTDAIAALPVDERFASMTRTVEWWSLRLRDAEAARPAGEGEDADGGARTDDARPRRAVVVPGLTVATPSACAAAASEDRAARRDFYRLNDAYGRRPDLLSGLR
jgi:hypothetical protein